MYAPVEQTGRLYHHPRHGSSPAVLSSEVEDCDTARVHLGRSNYQSTVDEASDRFPSPLLNTPLCQFEQDSCSCSSISSSPLPAAHSDAASDVQFGSLLEARPHLSSNAFAHFVVDCVMGDGNTHTHAMASSEALLLPIAELSVQSSVDVTAPEGEIVVGTE
jgi:hypothetical protein